MSVGWLGITLAALTLIVLAATAPQRATSHALYAAADRLVNLIMAPFAVATLTSGVILSLGTRWGLLRHTWVVAKLAITVAVTVVGATIAGQLVSRLALIAQPGFDGAIPPPTAPAIAVTILATAAALLSTATILSVYKPWGRLPVRRTPPSTP